MKLWQVKAEALRLMFADTDLTFSEEEFVEGIILNNSNTREKYLGMEGSIRRAIDIFNQFNGQYTKFATFSLDVVDEVYQNSIDLSQTENLDYPSRIDIIENLDAYISKAYNVNFNYDFLEKKVYFEEDDMAYFEGDITFKIYYQIEKINNFGQYQEVKITSGTDSQDILSKVMKKTKITKFEISSPSLNDIFMRIASPARKEAGNE